MSEYVSPDAADVPGWVALVGYLAPWSSILMFLSPIPTIRQVLRNGTVGDLPLLPYTSMVASCFVWVIYGFMKREPMIWGTNIVEFILSVYYFVEFTNYAPKQSPTFPGSVYSHIKLCIGIWVCSLWIAIFFSDGVSTIGDLTVLLTVMTFASPLAALKAVFEHQSSESIPWPFTLAALFNCCLWAIVGLWEMHDGFVSTPALLGMILAAVQVALKLHFGDNNNPDNPNYTRAPVEMPYPVLGSVRQVVMWGSNGSSSNNNNNNHFYNNLPQDLHFDSNMPSSNADYVELGVPLSNSNSNSELSQQSYVQPPQQQHMHQSPPPVAMNFANPIAQTQRKSNDGLEYSTVEGLESVVFQEEDVAGTPPHAASLRDSFRSRSGNSGQGHSHGF